MTVAVTYRLRLDDPVLAGEVGGDPSARTSAQYIPGSTIRGALIRAHAPAGFDAADGAMQRLFLSGATRYLNAYPLDGEGERMLPTPSSWVGKKTELDGDVINLYDLAAGAVEPDRPEAAPGAFCSASGSSRALITPSRDIAIHTQRDPVFGRARPGSGALFRYDALAAAGQFGGVVVCDHEEDGDTIAAVLRANPTLTLGASDTAGYGEVTVLHVNDPDAGWEEAWPEEDDVVGRLSVTLLSDVIVRDTWGTARPTAGTLATELGVAFGVTLKPAEAYVGASIAGGFNRRWRLPLAQEPALAMGSVVVLTIQGTLVDERRQHMHASGLGERRAEGYGRILIGRLAGQQVVARRESPPEPDEEDLPPIDDTSRAILTDMVEHFLRRNLDESLESWPNYRSVTGPPRNHQLARLRAVVRDALGGDPLAGRAAAADFLSHLAERSGPRGQFENAFVEEAGIRRSLLVWLQEVLTPSPAGETSAVWGKLDVNIDDAPALGDVKGDYTPALEAEYALRLTEAVLTRAMKRSEEGSHG